MTASRLPAPRSAPPSWRDGALAGLALLLATAVLHGAAVQSGWKFDDPGLLLYASSHSAWQTFTHPEAMRELSYAFLTPWNAFFFQMGLPWFGLDPAGHYVHLLLVLWAAALATWWLLALHRSRHAAWLGAGLFLASAPAAAVALSLMTGHYAWGLLLSIVALSAYITAVRRRHAGWAAAAALAYGLACLCKESYVPLVALWPLLAVGRWRDRIRMLLPAGLVALAYGALRLSVLGGLGGYAWMAPGSGVALSPWPQALAELVRQAPALCFGPGGWGAVAAGLAGAVIVLAWRRRGPVALNEGPRPAVTVTLVAGAALVVLAPVSPLFLNSPAHGRERVFLLAAWCLAVALAWVSDRHPLARGAALGALVAMVLAQRDVVQRYDQPSDWEHAQYQWLLASDPSQDLVPHEFRGLSYLDAMAGAILLQRGREPGAIVGDLEQLASLGPERGRRAWAWNTSCRCLQPLGDVYDEQVRRFVASTTAGSRMPASLEMTLTDRGSHKFVQWRIDGPPGAVRFDIRELDRLDVSREGRLAFGHDVMVRAPQLHFHVTIETPEGALVRSPLLRLPLSPSGRLHWRQPPEAS